MTALCLCVQGLGGVGVALCVGCDDGGFLGLNAGCHDEAPVVVSCCGVHHHETGPVAGGPDCGCVDVPLVSAPVIAVDRASPADALAAALAPACAPALAPAGPGPEAHRAQAGPDPSPRRRAHAARSPVLLI